MPKLNEEKSGWLADDLIRSMKFFMTPKLNMRGTVMAIRLLQFAADRKWEYGSVEMQRLRAIVSDVERTFGVSVGTSEDVMKVIARLRQHDIEVLLPNENDESIRQTIGVCRKCSDDEAEDALAIDEAGNEFRYRVVETLNTFGELLMLEKDIIDRLSEKIGNVHNQNLLSVATVASQTLMFIGNDPQSPLGPDDWPLDDVGVTAFILEASRNLQVTPDEAMHAVAATLAANRAGYRLYVQSRSVPGKSGAALYLYSNDNTIQGDVGEFEDYEEYWRWLETKDEKHRELKLKLAPPGLEAGVK